MLLPYTCVLKSRWLFHGLAQHSVADAVGCYAGYGGNQVPTNEQISLAGLLNLGSPRNGLHGHAQNIPGPGSAPTSSSLANLFTHDAAARLQATGAGGDMDPTALHSNAIPSPRHSGGHCSAIGAVNMAQQGGINGLSQSLRDDSAMQFGGYGPPDGSQRSGDAPSVVPGADHDDLAKLAQLYHPSTSAGACASPLDGSRQSWGGVGDTAPENGPLHGAHALGVGGAPSQQGGSVSGATGDAGGAASMWALSSPDVQDLFMRMQTPRDIEVGDSAAGNGRNQNGEERCSSGCGGNSDRGNGNAAQYIMPQGSQEDRLNRTISQTAAGAGDIEIPTAPSAGGEDDLAQFLQAQS